VFQELPALPAADLVAQQPAGLVACGRHDEHGRDVQLALAARTAAPLIAAGPVTGIPMYPAAVAKTARQAQMPMPLLELAAAIECMTRLEAVECQCQLPACPHRSRVTQTGRSTAGHSRAFIRGPRRRHCLPLLLAVVHLVQGPRLFPPR
jgi:hypothetical protein